jgi:hypothetical protein
VALSLGIAVLRASAQDACWRFEMAAHARGLQSQLNQISAQVPAQIVAALAKVASCS